MKLTIEQKAANKARRQRKKEEREERYPTCYLYDFRESGGASIYLTSDSPSILSVHVWSNGKERIELDRDIPLKMENLPDLILALSARYNALISDANETASKVSIQKLAAIAASEE